MIPAQCGCRHACVYAAPVRPKEILLTPQYLALVTEYVPGGTLLTYSTVNKVDEDQACYFFRQIVDAISYCHSRNIAYRDVKLGELMRTHTHTRAAAKGAVAAALAGWA